MVKLSVSSFPCVFPQSFFLLTVMILMKNNLIAFLNLLYLMTMNFYNLPHLFLIW